MSPIATAVGAPADQAQVEKHITCPLMSSNMITVFEHALYMEVYC